MMREWMGWISGEWQTVRVKKLCGTGGREVEEEVAGTFN
jgi:hypothetical protein